MAEVDAVPTQHNAGAPNLVWSNGSEPFICLLSGKLSHTYSPSPQKLYPAFLPSQQPSRGLPLKIYMMKLRLKTVKIDSPSPPIPTPLKSKTQLKMYKNIKAAMKTLVRKEGSLRESSSSSRWQPKGIDEFP